MVALVSGISRLRAWTMAARPRTLWAAVAPVAVGGGLAEHHGFFAPAPTLGALALTGTIQIATNLANDYYDFVKGADTKDRVGPTRVTQAGILTPAAVRNGMLVALACAACVGVWLTSIGGWPMAVVLALSLVCAVAYTGGPYPLGYNGLGDIFAFLFFGLVAVGGTVYLQDPSGWPGTDAFLAGAGVGALSTAILVTNNLRDRHTDRAVGKRTLAVIWGAAAARAEYVACLSVAVAVPVVGWSCFGWPAASLGALFAMAFAVRPLKLVLRARQPVALVPALGATAGALAVYGALLAFGLAAG